MTKDKAPISFLNMGTSSLLVIFLVLSIAIFATLSLSSAKSDYDFTKQIATQKQAYYEACGQSELTLATLDSILKAQADSCSSAQDYFDKILSSLDNEIKNIKIEHEMAGDLLTMSWTIPFGDTKQLYVSVSISYPVDSIDKHYYQILAWQTMPID